MVTTDFVLTELADGLAPLHSRRSAVRFIQSLRSDPDVRIIGASGKLLSREWELYADRLDKEWSLTDCISFVVMRERRIKDALTADHHFEQAGFTALLK
jgi:predicted nucleic acid-binding protein